MATDITKIEHGFTGEAYPNMFNLQAMPPQNGEKKPGQLPPDMIQRYFEDGYVIVEKFFSSEELNECREAVNNLVEDLAQKLYKAGKIKDLYSQYGFFERLIFLEQDFPGANILLHKNDRLPKAFRKLWANEHLLNVIEQLIGPDIAGHPVWNLRTKTPQNEATTVPWHQDSAYLNTDSYQVLQPTAWIPLLNADENNGCMQVAHRGHKTGIVGKHQCCYGGTWYVMLEEDEMVNTLVHGLGIGKIPINHVTALHQTFAKNLVTGVNLKKDIKTCPVPYGGMLLLNNLIPHRSLPNLSNQTRWSLDLRFQNPNLPFGFYGMKKGVLLRSSKDSSLKIRWDEFVNVDRRAKQRESVKELIEPAEDQTFDTTLSGPWMKKWEIIHVNQHTKRMEQEHGAWSGQKS